MLTGFTWCIPIKSKKATDVARTYMQHIYSILGGSMKILTDNGTEFKNEVFREVLQKLGTEKLIHSPPYRPQSNGRIEGFHRYLKACIAKHMRHSTRLCVDVPQFCSAIQTNLKGSSMDN